MKRIYTFVVLTLAIFGVRSLAVAQNGANALAPGERRDFKVEFNKPAVFDVRLKENGFAAFSWTTEEGRSWLSYSITNSAGGQEQRGDASYVHAAYFVAPKADTYSIKFFIDPKADDKQPQKVSLSLSDQFKVPANATVKDKRKAAGYDIELVTIHGSDDEAGATFATVKKGGRLKNILYGDIESPIMGFSFADASDDEGVSAQGKKSLALIKNTADKTGDGVPDVMLSYYSGGAHCCTTYYFIELPANGTGAIREVPTENAGMSAIGKAPGGGLRFATADNAWAYWNMSFAGSPMPGVILEFRNGVARPNFDLMKKPAPSLAVLTRKAAAARKKISNAPYTSDSGDFQFDEAFWSEMIDLMYTGHEGLAWKYLDMVWPKAKPGKDKFVADFKETLANSYYADKTK